MKKPRILLIGHSHTQCIFDAYGAGLQDIVDLDVVRLHRDKIVGSEPAFGEYIADQVAGFARVRSADPAPYDLVVSLMGGNTHNIVGLVEMSPPFDFVLSVQPSLRPSAHATLLPEKIVRNVLQQRIETIFTGMKVIREMYSDLMICQESPPPIGDDDYVRRYLDEHFQQDFKSGREIVSAELRYKLWKLASGIYSERCEQLGVPYVTCPEKTMIDGMYLQPEGYPGNATHGNKWYGEMVLRNVLIVLKERMAAQ